MSKVVIIGSGFSSFSAASTLAAKGVDVHIFEKNETVGGRSRQFSEDGFKFDMGPSWYWMPEIFERFFNNFGHSVSDFYELKKLNPSFKMFFGKQDVIDIPADFDELVELFEQTEKGAGTSLRKFMKEAEFKYNISMQDLIFKPGLSIFELINPKIFKGAFRLQLLESFHKHVRKHFSNPKLIAIMEFPVLFLGSIPKSTPALYSLMNYAGLNLGTWYPMGGFVKVIDGMREVAENLGVKIHTSKPVTKLITKNGTISSVLANGNSMDVDAVIGSADYHHIENSLLDNGLQSYSKRYWETRSMSPSCLIFYLGVNKRLKNITHHNLFFHSDIDKHSNQIHTQPEWPTDPLFYVCCPSKTDDTVAPEGSENLFFLIPIASGLEDTNATRAHYFDLVIEKFEAITEQNIKENIIYKKSYCINDFKEDYNAYKGNAYGLANTLNQTANLKPKIKSKKVSNLYFSGQLTVPGPGVPPSIISGEISANELLKKFKL
jgi:phytoene desaturase